MPRSVNGDVQRREKSSRSRRNSLTYVRSLDDTMISYRSTPEYLRQLINTSTNSNSIRTRRNSANASIHSEKKFIEHSVVKGNPKYKAQEDYYDEVQTLKKDLKSFQIENSHLRAKLRRLEEDNTRKRRELDEFYQSHKNENGRRSSITSLTDRSSNTSVMNLKQRLFKLELQLKQKETIIDEMKRDPCWTEAKELKIQFRELLQEIERERLNHLKYVEENDYMATLDEEQKNAVRKLTAEKNALAEENDSLRKKILDLTDPEEKPLTAVDQRQFEEKIERLKDDCRLYQNDLEEMKSNWKRMRRERDKYLDEIESIKEQFEEMKRERNEYRRKCRQLEEELEENRSIRRKMKREKTLDDPDVKKFRQNHAAKVIQRGWREFHQTNKVRSSRKESPSQDNALKLIQAALRGYLHRTSSSPSHRSSSSFIGNQRTGSIRLNSDWRSSPSFDRSHSSRNSLIKAKSSGKLSTVQDDDANLSDF